MTEKEYLEAVIEDLEIEEEVTLESNFRELEDWSSLMGFSFLAFISHNFDKNITPNQFLKFNTFKDVYEFVKK
ncbi:MAG: acyl carrier protein [Cetobacterium sp.]